MYLVPVALRDARLLGAGSRRCQHLLKLVLLEQVGNLAGVQHVVDVLQELLHYNLRTSPTNSSFSNSVHHHSFNRAVSGSYTQIINLNIYGACTVLCVPECQ